MKSDFPNARVSNETCTLITRNERANFPWGRVTAIHEVGEYRIIQYLERVVDGCTVTQQVGTVTAYHVDGTSSSFSSLDAALAGAIAYKHEGPNSRAAAYFMKMLKDDAS